MALVDARFDNVKAYGIVKLDVLIGENFHLTLTPDKEGDICKWLFYNDPILDTRVKGNDAAVKAAEEGESEIWIFDSTNTKIMTLFINVWKEIPAPAVDLGLKAGKPEPKDKAQPKIGS